eukprot:GHVR01133563.1.p1 GENE.GHVR01133563.1~~GHVR01133563.1.p1  ORF type:complete len:491 (+),score=128.62 GHVR01133563.1:30-1502(+)
MRPGKEVVNSGDVSGSVSGIEPTVSQTINENNNINDPLKNTCTQPQVQNIVHDNINVTNESNGNNKQSPTPCKDSSTNLDQISKENIPQNISQTTSQNIQSKQEQQEFHERQYQQTDEQKEGKMPNYNPPDTPHKDSGTNMADLACLPQPTHLITHKPDITIHPCDDMPPECCLSDNDINLLDNVRHNDPYSVLGAHVRGNFKGDTLCVIRAWVRNARRVRVSCVSGSSFVLSNDNEPVEMFHRGAWLFEKAFYVCGGKMDTHAVSCHRLLYELKVTYHDDGEREWGGIRDAFSFPLLLQHNDLCFFQSGSCWHVDSLMGSHYKEVEGAKGTRFAVWAPTSQFVSVVGDWNGWDGRAHPMRKRHEFGVWEIFVPVAIPGMKYGYRIVPHDGGADMVKIDPYAQHFENPPGHSSIISTDDDAFKPESERFTWTDHEWMEKRKRIAYSGELKKQPISIYEVTYIYAFMCVCVCVCLRNTHTHLYPHICTPTS